MSLFDNCSRMHVPDEVKTVIYLKYGPVVATEEYLNKLPEAVTTRVYDKVFGNSPFRHEKDNVEKQRRTLGRIDVKKEIEEALIEYHVLHP